MMASVCAEEKISSDVLNDALASSADGFSSDEVMIRDELRSEFLNEVGRRVGVSIAGDQERDVFLSLLQLRKAGKMTYRATKRAPSPTSDVSTVAEIAARAVTDRHSVSTDVMLADSVLRAELQTEARLIDPSVDGYQVRKSVLGLRKKRALRPELVLQVANWDREVVTWSLAELKAKLKVNKVAHCPGVYMFRTEEGYLYIGEAIDLSNRLIAAHIDTKRRGKRPNFTGGLPEQKRNPAKYQSSCTFSPRTLPPGKSPSAVHTKVN